MSCATYASTHHLERVLALQQEEHGLQVELDVRVIALRAVAGAGGVRTQPPFAVLLGRDVFEGQDQGGALAGEEALAPLRVALAIALVVLGLAILE